MSRRFNYSRERDPFLESYEWRTVRMRILERDGAKCACCGATAADGVRINVDHIKNRRQYPELALTLSNLQVLCDACNHGKGNKYETDWRPRQTPSPLAREIIQRILLRPQLARSDFMPEWYWNALHLAVPDDPADYRDGAALRALLEFCQPAEHPLSTAGVMQHFCDSAHEQILTDALVTAEDAQYTDEQAADYLKRAVRAYWLAQTEVA